MAQFCESLLAFLAVCFKRSKSLDEIHAKTTIFTTLFDELSHDSSVRECNPGGIFDPSHMSHEDARPRLRPKTVDPRTRLTSVSWASKEEEPCCLSWDLFLGLPLRDPGPGYTGPVRGRRFARSRAWACFFSSLASYFFFPSSGSPEAGPPKDTRR